MDISYTIEERSPYRPGDFFQSWSVNAGTTVRRSRLLIDVPKDLALRIDERNLNFQRRETIAGNRKVYEWATKDVAWNRPEMFEPGADSNNVSMWLSVSAPGSWSDIGKWYAGLSHTQLASGSQIQDSVHRITAHATTLEDSIRAIHRWVAQDVRYVSVSLGIGGYQPRSPATVLATGFGDCKDKATLFIAALSDIGVQAYPVLLNAGGRPDRAVPTIGAFDHEIAAIKRPNGYQFVDLTSELSRFGTLPYGDEDEFALIVHPDGTTEEVTTPRDKPAENKTSSLLTGTLSTDGKFNGRVEIVGTGISELGLRGMMRTPMDSAQRADLQRRMAAAIFPNARGDSLVTFDGKDFHATARIAFVVRDGDATQQSGETDILTLRSAAAHWGQVADQLEAHGARKNADRRRAGRRAHGGGGRDAHHTARRLACPSPAQRDSGERIWALRIRVQAERARSGHRASSERCGGRAPQRAYRGSHRVAADPVKGPGLVHRHRSHGGGGSSGSRDGQDLKVRAWQPRGCTGPA